MEYRIKRLRPDGIAAAIEKADKYRELNQPAEAESICRDVLAVDAENQLALRTLGLALTDQLGPNSGERFAQARDVFGRLVDPYERRFYTGLAYERHAKAQLPGRLPVEAIRPLLEQALACYDEAERLRPAGNDDAVLRWNSCVRTLEVVGPASSGRAEPDDTECVPAGRI